MTPIVSVVMAIAKRCSTGSWICHARTAQNRAMPCLPVFSLERFHVLPQHGERAGKLVTIRRLAYGHHHRQPASPVGSIHCVTGVNLIGNSLVSIEVSERPGQVSRIPALMYWYSIAFWRAYRTVQRVALPDHLLIDAVVACTCLDYICAFDTTSRIVKVRFSRCRWTVCSSAA